MTDRQNPIDKGNQRNIILMLTMMSKCSDKYNKWNYSNGICLLVFNLPHDNEWFVQVSPTTIKIIGNGWNKKYFKHAIENFNECINNVSKFA